MSQPTSGSSTGAGGRAGPPAPPSSRPESASPRELVRSEEVLRTGTRWVGTERITVRRRTVTETRQVEVTLQREELVITREALDDVPPAPGATPGASSPLVVVLLQEVPVVSTEVRPYERVTLTVDLVPGIEAVSASVRSEQIVGERLDTPVVRPD